MICDKCGKSNIQELSECAYCGAEMPRTSGGGGFADILNYKEASGAEPYERKSDGVSEENMEKLIKKSDKLIKCTKKNSVFGLIAVVLCGVLLLLSVAGNIVIMSKIGKLDKEVVEYKKTVDMLLKKEKNEPLNNKKGDGIISLLKNKENS